MITDVVIIGAGASGLCAAVYLKQQNPSLSVRLIEAMPRVGKKLALTGNGRCNITNKNIILSRYHGEHTKFCEYALKKYDRTFCEQFFEKIGVSFVFEGDKAFPASLQASSVVDCLRFAADELKVITHLETKVTNIQITNGNYRVVAGDLSFLAKKVIVAAGLFSGGEKMGCDGSMLALLKKSGFKTVKTTPAIVQVKTETDVVKQLKGIKADGTVTLMCSGKEIRKESGEILFCDYGLSGPPILQVSRSAFRDDGKYEISLDLMPYITKDELIAVLKVRSENLSYLNLDEFLTGFINKRLGQVIVKLSGGKLNENVQSLSYKNIVKIAETIKDFRFKVVGNTGFTNSQVTAGGLDTDGFSADTMESLANKGFFAVGEILDIDGDCGGFNLQWAWSSAFCACDAILKDLSV